METLNLNFILLVAIFVGYSTAIPATPCSNTTLLGVYTECTDCVTAIVCNNNVPGPKKKCASTVPYCNNGACGNVRDPSLTPNESSCPQAKLYNCTSLGLFPDPLDCSRYLSCRDVNIGKPTATVACPTGFVFSDATGGCKKATVPADCVTVNCEVTMGNGVFSPYGASKIYYALCTEKAPTAPPGTTTTTTTVKPPPIFEQLFESNQIALFDDMNEFEEIAATIDYDILVLRCAKGAEFDRTPSISSCVYKCTKEGYFEYSLNKSLYYDCKTINGTGILRKCEGNTEFDKDLGLCI